MLTFTNSNVLEEQHKFLTVSNLPFVRVGATMLYKFDDATWNAITQHYAGASNTIVDFYEALTNK